MWVNLRHILFLRAARAYHVMRPRRPLSLLFLHTHARYNSPSHMWEESRKEVLLCEPVTFRDLSVWGKEEGEDPLITGVTKEGSQSGSVLPSLIIRG